MSIAVESEGVMAGRDPNRGSDLEYGFEADSFLANEACALVSAAFGALANAAYGLDVLLVETAFIAVNSDPPWRVCDGQCGKFGFVRVVVGILDQLKKKMGGCLI
jgi:hypothetical protein